MTAVATPPPEMVPSGRFNWLKISLVVSLAVNLLFVGGGIARFFSHRTPERMSGISQMQLIPRNFLNELDRSRRAELMKVFKEFAPSFRAGRKVARDDVIKLAVALEAEPYDNAVVKAAVDAFSEHSSELVNDGGKAALTLISSLSPEERKLLARHIRLRDEGGRKRGPPDSKD